MECQMDKEYLFCCTEKRAKGTWLVVVVGEKGVRRGHLETFEAFSCLEDKCDWERHHLQKLTITQLGFVSPS